MEALVLGHPGVERTRLEQLLTEHGHDVNACHDRSWGCVGMDGACPLDASKVDVAIAVAEPGDRFDPQGIACAHRARIPIITIGAMAEDPVLHYTARNLARVDRSVLAAMKVAADDAPGHRDAVRRALDEHLADGEEAQVVVHRHPRRIEVHIVGSFPPARTAAIADHARAAVRTYDPHVDVIDVSVIDTLDL